jgi:hypothetical protein
VATKDRTRSRTAIAHAASIATEHPVVDAFNAAFDVEHGGLDAPDSALDHFR